MENCNQEELETVMSVLDNPIKRKIIRKLSEEPTYALQLSKELRLGQQNVNKHLKNMEMGGIIESVERESPSGPKRKQYSIKKFYSLRIDFGPNLYLESLRCLDNSQELAYSDLGLEKFKKRLEEIRALKEKGEKLDGLNILISEIEDEINSLEEKRAGMLLIRNMAMKEAGLLMSDLPQPERRVMYRILDQKTTSCEAISEQLDMRENKVREVIKKLIERGLKSIEVKVDKSK